MSPVVDPHYPKIAQFLNGIGISVREGCIPEDSFLPGILVRDGGLIVDPRRPIYPGDLLHEAGHLAVLEPLRRAANLEPDGGEEMAAIAWSYAAALAIPIDPAIVFHPFGYRGAGQSLLDNFKAGRYVGVPLLEWMGLAATREASVRLGVARYPHMLCWLRP